MPYQSPISPGISWYEDTAGPRPEYPALDGDRRADVVIVGGGFTGLSAAAHLAKSGADVVLIDANRFGDGASGRNGGQLGTGQRSSLDELEAELGWTRAKALFDLAEEAKAHLLEFAAVNGIDIDFMPGQLSVAHKQRYVEDYRKYADYMRERAGYEHISFMDADGNRRAAWLDALFRWHARHRHRPYPSAEAHRRDGTGGGGSWRAPVRDDPGDRHRIVRRQGAGDDADRHDHRRQGR